MEEEHIICGYHTLIDWDKAGIEKVTALIEVRVTPQKCIVVEDARAGIDAAIRGRMRTIGIGDAAHYEKTDFAIQKFTDILEVERKFLSIDKM